MAFFDAAKEGYELAEIDGRPVLFTNMRLDRDTVPDGIFCYDVRDSDRLDGSMAEIKAVVVVNHWGTILCKGPFPVDESGSYYPEDWGYLGKRVPRMQIRACGWNFPLMNRCFVRYWMPLKKMISMPV